MKYLLLLLFVVGCSKKPVEPTYTAMSCDREGCIELNTFPNEYECKGLLSAIVKLHKMRGDKPKYVMDCQENK